MGNVEAAYGENKISEYEMVNLAESAKKRNKKNLLLHWRNKQVNTNVSKMHIGSDHTGSLGEKSFLFYTFLQTKERMLVVWTISTVEHMLP